MEAEHFIDGVTAIREGRDLETLAFQPLPHQIAGIIVIFYDEDESRSIGRLPRT